VIINQAFFVFISVLTPLSIAPLTPIFMQEFHKTLPQVNYLFGAAAISLGYTNFVIVPFSNVFGRRPAILICGLICVLANVWQALTTSYASFIGARVISGFGAGANESIMPMVIADVMFIHQRGLWMGLYLYVTPEWI
jgi:MFS family permease